MIRVAIRLLGVVICLATMSDVTNATQLSFHDAGRDGTPSISVSGFAEDPSGTSRSTWLDIEYVAHSDEYPFYPGMWLIYSEYSDFLSYGETRLLYCPVDSNAVHVSAQARKATMSADLNVAICYQEAYRLRYDTGTYESMDALAGTINVNVSLEDAADDLVFQRTGTERIGNTLINYSCRREGASDFRKVRVNMGVLNELLADRSSAMREVCNVNALGR